MTDKDLAIVTITNIGSKKLETGETYYALTLSSVEDPNLSITININREVGDILIETVNHDYPPEPDIYRLSAFMIRSSPMTLDNIIIKPDETRGKGYYQGFATFFWPKEDNTLEYMKIRGRPSDLLVFAAINEAPLAVPVEVLSNDE